MADTPQIIIDRIPAETVRVPIVGTAPLLVHKFSEKAKRQMLDNMQGKKSPRLPKDPKAEFEAAFYRMKDGVGYGFPVIAFKAATVGGARFYGKAISMTALRQFIFFKGEPSDDGQLMAPIVGEPVMREDVVKVGQGTDLRYRPQFLEWSSTLEVTYVTSSLTQGSLISLIDAGGMGVGVGEWRPERKGDFGTYRIDPTRRIEVLSS